jgi:DNA-binding HxlR family transcriptional regulator
MIPESICYRPLNVPLFEAPKFNQHKRVFSVPIRRTNNNCPGCSKKMLTQTVREMERDRLIDRKVYPVVPPMVETSLTPMGRLFIEPIEMLCAWGAKNADVLSKLRGRRKKHTASRDKERKVQ